RWRGQAGRTRRSRSFNRICYQLRRQTHQIRPRRAESPTRINLRTVYAHLWQHVAYRVGTSSTRAWSVERVCVVTRCEQPDCTGTIVDGYCDVCGLAPSRAESAAPAAQPTTTGCEQPGCTGTIEDGYCTVCGLAPEPPRTSSAATIGSTPSGISR